MKLSKRNRVILYLINQNTLRDQAKVIRYFKTPRNALFYKMLGSHCSTYISAQRDGHIFRYLINEGLIERPSDGRHSLFAITVKGIDVLNSFKSDFQ